MRGTWVAALVGAAVALIVAVPAQADPTIQPTEGMAADIGRLSAQLAEANKDLRDASVAASVAIEKYERAVVLQQRAAKKLKTAKATAVTAGVRVDSQASRVANVVRDNYELGGSIRATAMVLSGQPSNFLNNMGYLRYVGDQQSRTLEGYRQAKGAADLAEGGARSALAACTAARKRAADAKQRAQDAVDARASKVADIKSHRADLQQQLDDIVAHNAAARAAIAAKARRAAAARAAAQRRAAAATNDATQVDYHSGGAMTAVNAALNQVGKPYVWDAADPSVGFDCSGLVLYAYEQIGIYLPHSAEYQYLQGWHPSVGQLQPGDLLFYSYNGQVSGIHHVTMYIGHGMIVQAADFGIPVQVVPAYFDFGYLGATRVV